MQKRDDKTALKCKLIHVKKLPGRSTPRRVHKSIPLYIKMHKIQALKYIKIAYYCVLIKKIQKMKAAEFRASPGLLKQ